MVYISPYIFSLGYWTIFFIVINAPNLSFFAFIGLLVWFLMAVIFIAGKLIYRHWNIWLNYLFFLSSSFAITLILNSGVLRNFYVIVSGLVAGIFIYIVLKYFRDHNIFFAASYLRLVSFTYLITFWQIFIVLYFAVISFDFSIWQASLVAAPIIYVLARGMFNANSLKKSSLSLVLMVIILTTTEFFIFLERLPLHYFVLSALLTMWFFYIIEVVLTGQELSSRKRVFKIYSSILLAGLAVLLVTARWG
jgi:hypothetical protein